MLPLMLLAGALASTPLPDRADTQRPSTPQTEPVKAVRVEARALKVTATEETCHRGCSTTTGECWKLLVTVLEDDATDGNTPSLTRRFYYIGEPYPTKEDALCGARKLRQRGICTASGLGTENQGIQTATAVLSNGSEPNYPGFDDCPGQF